MLSPVVIGTHLTNTTELPTPQNCVAYVDAADCYQPSSASVTIASTEKMTEPIEILQLASANNTGNELNVLGYVFLLSPYCIE